MNILSWLLDNFLCSDEYITLVCYKNKWKTYNVKYLNTNIDLSN